MEQRIKYPFSGTVVKTGQKITGIFDKLYLHDANNPLLITDKYVRVFKTSENIQPFDGVSKFKLSTGEETTVYTVENVEKLIEIQRNEEQQYENA